MHNHKVKSLCITKGKCPHAWSKSRHPFKHLTSGISELSSSNTCSPASDKGSCALQYKHALPRAIFNRPHAEENFLFCCQISIFIPVICYLWGILSLMKYMNMLFSLSLFFLMSSGSWEGMQAIPFWPLLPSCWFHSPTDLPAFSHQSDSI